MRIIRLKATFGKFSGQTLTLEPGFNMIEAPNEWGKSTWCAFLMAMLYGIDTGTRSKAGFLADKEHYAPWSGEPMSGRMDILWNGREITIERRSKGRIPMGEVSAFETQTGIPVPELSVAAPGQVLLGVEKSVFARAGFLKHAQMPVTEDESLRRRLNELVTTGDESGASDDLNQKLRDLKNRCRFNKKGLLPELEMQQTALQQKLQQVAFLQEQKRAIIQQQTDLETEIGKLENHQHSLEYAAQLQYMQKWEAAQLNREKAGAELARMESACEGLPSQEKIRQDLAQLQTLRADQEKAYAQLRLLPPLPQVPVCPEPFRGKEAQTLLADVQLDSKVLEQLRNDSKKPVGCILGAVLLALGLGALIVSGVWAKVCAGVLLLCGATLLVCGLRKQQKLKKQIAEILARYWGMPEGSWQMRAQEYAKELWEYNRSTAAVETEKEKINALLGQMETETVAVTGGQSVAYFEGICREHLGLLECLQDAKRAFLQAEEVLQALSGAGKQVEPPLFADDLTWTAQETQARLAEKTAQKQMLQHRLGQCQGQMETLGQPEALQKQLAQVQQRIAALETYYRALQLAMETLQQATLELQRRFAPRISKRAQELFSRLTDNRYQRLTLGQDLSVEVSAEGENTLRGTLWRSDGTVDQLYLALRLAVAEELTPNAPLILDDALVCFDDVRLASALKILQEEAAQKQVIVFTCQSREKALQSKQEAIQ